MELIIDGRKITVQPEESLLDMVKRLGLLKGNLTEDPIVAKIAGEVFTLNYVPLRQQDVQPERGCVVVPGRCSKTGGGRVVPLRRRELLKGMRLRIPRNWAHRWKRLRRAAGFTDWQPDVCRHTFASYHAAYFRDLGALQLEMGHRSTDLLRSRYLNLPQVNQAKVYWNAR